jgi:hypothetical protein
MGFRDTKYTIYFAFFSFSDWQYDFIPCDGIDHGRSLVNSQCSFDGFGIGIVNGTGDIYHLLDRFYQPFQVLRFIIYENSGVDIDVVGARFYLISGNFLDSSRIPRFDGRTNGLAAGIDQFTNDNHANSPL